MRFLWQITVTVGLLLGGLAQAQQPCMPSVPALNPPLKITPLVYNSPYGPRNKVSTGQYQFHRGVDYHGGLGTPIYAVQGSIIDKLDFEGSASSGWVLSIRGTSADSDPCARFSYLHLFDNSFLNNQASLQKDPEGNIIYAMTSINGTGQSITLERLKSTSCFAIVFWVDRNGDNPDRALSPCPNLSIGKPDFAKTTTNVVSTGDLIAVVGQSGGAATGGAHLHLQVNGGDQNPLLFVQHDSSNPPGYAVNLFRDQGTDIATLDASEIQLNGGEVLNPGQYGPNTPFILRAEVDYSNLGHDLNEVQIFMANNGTTVIPACSATGLSGDFNYGGTGQSRNVFFGYEPLSDAVLCQGVYPQANRGGVVDFLAAPLDLTTVNPGSYLISVSTLDVVGDAFEEKSVSVTIPPKLSVMVNGPGTVLSALPGLNHGIDNCAQGQTCQDWFDPSVASTITLIATPGPSAVFTGWSGDCTGAGPSVAIVLSTNKSCVATFQLITFTLTLQFAGSGTGEVDVSSGPFNTFFCSTGCSAVFPSGTSVTLRAGPFPGSVFTGWSGDCAGTAPFITIVLSQNRSCIATFTQICATTLTQPIGHGIFAYVANFDSNSISVIDTASNLVVSTIACGPGPVEVAGSPDGSQVYVTNENGNTLSIIDISKQTITTVGTGPRPFGIAFTPDGTKAYVSDSGSGGILLLFNTVTKFPIRGVLAGVGPSGMAITPDGRFLYVANDFSDVSVIDTVSNSIIASVPVGPNPTWVAITPNGAFAYVTNFGGNTVSVIDTAANIVVATVTVDPIPVEVAISPDGTRAYVTSRVGNDVSVIDTASNTVLTTISVGFSPAGIAVTPDGRFVYVANQSSASVSVIDTTLIGTTKNPVSTTIPVQVNPFGIAIVSH